MKATKICKICGNEYEYCHTFRRDGIFRWQDVACCVEHGNQYFAKVAESRGEDSTSNTASEVMTEDVIVKEEPQIETDKSEDVIDTYSEFISVPKKKSRK